MTLVKKNNVKQFTINALRVIVAQIDGIVIHQKTGTVVTLVNCYLHLKQKTGTVVTLVNCYLYLKLSSKLQLTSESCSLWFLVLHVELYRVNGLRVFPLFFREIAI